MSKILQEKELAVWNPHRHHKRSASLIKQKTTKSISFFLIISLINFIHIYLIAYVGSVPKLSLTVNSKVDENRCRQKYEQIQVMGTLHRFTAV